MRRVGFLCCEVRRGIEDSWEAKPGLLSQAQKWLDKRGLLNWQVGLVRFCALPSLRASAVPR